MSIKTDLHAAARRALGEELHRYVQGQPIDLAEGAGDPNEAAFAAYRLIPRTMRGQAGIDLATPFFGEDLPAPLAVGAYAADRLLSPDGIGPIAKVCHALGLPLIVSEECITPLAEIAAMHGRLWLQLRAAGPKDRVLRLVDEAARHGARGVVLTVLAPVHPRPGLHPGGVDIAGRIGERGWSTIGDPSGVAALPPFPAWSWTDVADVQRHAAAAGLAVIAKGILHPDDGAAALETGCAGLLVSNIGARQFGRWVAAVDRIGTVRARCGDKAAILVDGGIRNGGDIVIASLLGADIAVVVRPVILALAAGGESAVRRLLLSLIDETAAIASWMGAAKLGDLGADQIIRAQA
ncbi:alpha-hydroxy acid oxidase [Labrys monachus]|uniref:Isopentenyl diphosphate isomerase/L-lactate dehydrogenase-like FMN-dependent dehydrogenase n=1 Tax=Labrys monachus TaxID=217067 RepID=A0ABU0FIU3_9HYPH|nr:alpha-hydroxy acid oxidase [Labrys monachus]MDQ0394431.1 isopentenyl diphosphate isomerase/L-lactate dehydrogenase-like FMN-dependent dehydrogenase [Labrys monachus]